MFRNYFKTLVRFMLKQKGFSLINICGLTIGIVASLLILLFVLQELSYDRFHADGNRIFRLGIAGDLQETKTRSAHTGFPLASAIQAEPGTESTLRMARWKTFPVKYEDRSYTEKHLLLADPNFFRFFSFRLLHGHPDSVLLAKQTAVITESAARRYFDYKPGQASPVGKTLILAQGYPVTVTGIAEDPPAASHFGFSIVVSLSSWEASPEEYRDWLGGKVYTYYKTYPGTVSEAHQTALTRALDQQLHRHLENRPGAAGSSFHYFAQPLPDIHLRSDLPDEVEDNGSLMNLILLGCLAAFITLLACINFMNLTTAQSATRAREVAVRKSVGAGQYGLAVQFLMESYCYIAIAVVLALALIALALTPFNHLTGKSISIGWLLAPEFIAGILLFIAITGLVAGSYPSFYLSRFNPVEVLRGNLRARVRTYGVRNVLVVFQFFISAALIISTLVVYEQLRFIQKMNLGFDKSNLVNLLHTRNLKTNGAAFKQALLDNPSVMSASYCNRLPPNVDWQSAFRPAGATTDFLLTVYEMDPDHLETMGYKMVSGRFFEKDFAQDTAAVIINETAARKLKLADIHNIRLFTNYDQPAGREREVIGIIQDFNFHSLKDPIQPMAVVLGFQPNWEMAIRIRQGDLESTLEFIRAEWKKYAPDAAFEYSLVEENFDSKHATEKRIGVLFLVFTVLAIAIACLGLFGLATFTAEQQRKQIGIRKVLGASAAHIVLMLNKDFLKLVLIANLLAWPLTWWVMNKWLSQFAYHTGIAWWIFATEAIITFTIALLSVSVRAFAAASGNPVHSLRTE